MDRGPLSAGLAIGTRFRLVDEDGSDPSRIAANAKQTLVEFVATRPGLKQTFSIYHNRLWKMLERRAAVLPVRANNWERLLAAHGLQVLTHEDFSHAALLGLEWPETDLSEDEYGQEFASRAEVGDRDFSSLDGIATLLGLRRSAQQRGDTVLATALLPVITTATQVISKQLPEGEARDTWDYIVRTRLLAWIPNYAPGPDFLARATAEAVKAFNERGAVRRRGRPSVGPLGSRGGKVDQRWRRRIWIAAANIALAQPGPSPEELFVRPANEFTQWLVKNRALIAAHAERVQGAFDPIFGAERNDARQLPALVVPHDRAHPQRRPAFNEIEDEFFGAQRFDLLFPEFCD